MGREGTARAGRTRSAGTIDAYLSRLEPSQRILLSRLRAAIRSAAPDAQEVISHGMPAFRRRGMLLYFGAFKDHCSLFTAGSVRIRRLFSEEIRPYESGRGTLRFSTERPLPLDLVRRIVQARVEENEAHDNLRRAPSGEHAVSRVHSLRTRSRRVRAALRPERPD